LLRGTKEQVAISFVLFPVKLVRRIAMPLVLLWVGIPVFLLGGGYFVIHAMH
jgi:hypothetical protein